MAGRIDDSRTGRMDHRFTKRASKCAAGRIIEMQAYKLQRGTYGAESRQQHVPANGFVQIVSFSTLSKNFFMKQLIELISTQIRFRNTACIYLAIFIQNLCNFFLHVENKATVLKIVILIVI